MKRVLPVSALMVVVCCCAVSALDGQNGELRSRLSKRYGNAEPKQWSEKLPGVTTKLSGGRKEIALTFDACGSKNDGFDAKLIDFLVKEKVPATLFICGRWIDKYPDIFKELAKNPLFEIENHGLNHKPASVSGRIAYKINGTANVAELVDEIELNARKIESITGRKPKYFRAGMAYYDEVAVQVVQSLGIIPAGFSVLGDAGATFTKAQVEKALLDARAGDIVICHMNHPGRGTAEGVIAAVPELRSRGYKFVTLENH
jgi:peptidoglycan/xylan/chitin deacetylase (PgdA/CDA1 family)